MSDEQTACMRETHVTQEKTNRREQKPTCPAIRETFEEIALGRRRRSPPFPRAKKQPNTTWDIRQTYTHTHPRGTETGWQ